MEMFGLQNPTPAPVPSLAASGVQAASAGHGKQPTSSSCDMMERQPSHSGSAPALGRKV